MQKHTKATKVIQRETRTQWLAKCIKPWRQLMASIEQDPKEVANSAGLSIDTVLGVIQGKTDPNKRSYQTSRKIIAAILRFSGQDVTAEDVDAEGSHVYDMERGHKPHCNEDSWVYTAHPTQCRLCPRERYEGSLRSLQRQAAAVSRLRQFAATLSLTPSEMEVVLTACKPDTGAAEGLAEGLRSWGMAPTAKTILQPENRRLFAGS